MPFGFIVARARGVDIRRTGSGNIGATNVFRCVGKGWGVLTLACDGLKGFAAAVWLPAAVAAVAGRPTPPSVALLYACMAVVGHNWPVYLGFRGGKGVATTAGALVGVAPAAFLVGLGVWLLVFVLSRYVSLASMVAATVIPVVAWWRRGADGVLVPTVLTLLAVAVLVRHRSNIRRLIDGTETRIRFSRAPDSGPSTS